MQPASRGHKHVGVYSFMV